jgi:hypothetical protein
MRVAFPSSKMNAWLGAVSLLFSLHAAHADLVTKTKPTSASLVYGQGLLWKVEKSGVVPSHLFGTIHSDDPRITNLPKVVRTAFDNSQSVTIEFLQSTDTGMEMMSAMVLPNEQTLVSIIGPDLYSETQKAFARHGFPPVGLEKFQPWVPAMLLAVPPPKLNGLFLDLALLKEATDKGKPTHGLETIKEQIAVFSGLSQTDQIALLRETLSIHEQLLNREFENMLRLYLARDVAGILAIDEKYSKSNPDLHQKLMTRALTDRNRVMVERMQPLLAEGRAFVAIGAAHLPGESGVLRLLEQKGYKVTRLY